MSIAKAIMEGYCREVKTLKQILTRLSYVKLQAVKRATSNKRSMIVGHLNKGCFCKCLSRMTGNCHVRFLGGAGVVRP